MATARRMSRASGMGVGIPLPDLLSTIPGPEEGSVQERLEKMVNLVVNSAIRLPAHALVWYCVLYPDLMLSLRQVEAGVQEEFGGLEEAVKEVSGCFHAF